MKVPLLAFFTVGIEAEIPVNDICEDMAIPNLKNYCDNLHYAADVYGCYHDLASVDRELHRQYRREKASLRSRIYYFKSKNYEEQARVARKAFDRAYLNLCNAFILSPEDVKILD